MSKRLFALVALFFCVQLSFAAWDGSVKIPKAVATTEGSSYEITSPEELIGFLDSIVPANAAELSLKAHLKNDIVFGADTSKLSTKKWVRHSGFTYFSGDFDGRGHTIYGMNADKALF